MSMTLTSVISNGHEDNVLSFAYNQAKREVFSSAHGGNQIHVWNARNGRLLRRQTGHNGCVTGLAFDERTRILFSVSLDGCIALWCDRGSLLHLLTVGMPLFSITLHTDLRVLAVGGQKTLHLFSVSLDSMFGLSHESRSVFMDTVSTGASKEDGNSNVNCIESIFERLCPVLVGPEFSHADIVQAIKITDSGKIITSGHDGCLCVYELEKPKESFRKIIKAHASAISSLEFDQDQNLILTGGYDGCFKIWSNEGRCIEVFENISDAAVISTYVSVTKEYWIIGKGGRVTVLDSKGPKDITQFVHGTKDLEDKSAKPLSLILLHSAPDSKILLGATNNKSIVLWNFDHNREYRIFKNSNRTAIECLLTVQTKDELSGVVGSEIFTGDTRGMVSCWRQEADKSSDIFKVQSCYSLNKSNLLCIVHVPQLELFVSGGDDGTVLVFQTEVNGDVKKTKTILAEFGDHSDKVTSLAVIGDFVISGSHDKSIRVWDMRRLLPVQVIPLAHSSPIQCLDYSRETETLASCAMNHIVKIWSAHEPKELSLLRVLNHKLPCAIKSLSHSTKHGGSHITTSSNIDGDLTFDKQEMTYDGIDVVEQAILDANVDVPEVTQVRWVSYQQCWISTANDELICLWDTQGTLLQSFLYKGGPVQYMFVDNINRQVLISTLDSNVSVMKLDHPMPVTIFHGHGDIVRSISYLPERDLYVTGSWDGSLRFWHQSPRQIPEKSKSKVPPCRSLSIKADSEIPCAFMEPMFLNTDYSQLWKTIALMEEYENKHTTKWSGDEPLITPSSPQGQAPVLLDKLLDDIERRGLDQILNKSQPKPPKRTFKKTATVLNRLSIKRRD